MNPTTLTVLATLLLAPLAAPHAAEPWWHEYTPVATVGLRAESLETIQPSAARGVGTLGWYGFWFLDAQEQAGYCEAGSGKLRQAGVRRIVYYDLGEVGFFTRAESIVAGHIASTSLAGLRSVAAATHRREDVAL